MTKNEVKEMLVFIDGVYPNFINNRDINSIFNSWYLVFQHQDNKRVRKKLNDWIMKSSYPPAPCNLLCADWSDYE